MIALLQADAALDALYALILDRLRVAELEDGLQSVLERLCRVARAQDEALPLALLPVWSYAAAGGCHQQRAIAAAAAWRCLHVAGKMLNDAARLRPSLLLPGEPATTLLNVGVSLVFLSQAVLSQAAASDVREASAIRLQAEFARAGLRAASGQQVRLEREADLSCPDYQAVTALRSGDPLALAARAGALVRWDEHPAKEGMEGAPPDYVEALTTFGHHLGMMLQLTDDWNGTWRPQGRSDLAAGKRTWPLLYGEMLANEDQRTRLTTLARRATGDSGAETELQALLVQLDVPLAMVVAAEEHRCQAEAALQPLGESEARRALAALARRATLAPRETR